MIVCKKLIMVFTVYLKLKKFKSCFLHIFSFYISAIFDGQRKKMKQYENIFKFYVFAASRNLNVIGICKVLQTNFFSRGLLYLTVL